MEMEHLTEYKSSVAHPNIIAESIDFPKNSKKIMSQGFFMPKLYDLFYGNGSNSSNEFFQSQEGNNINLLAPPGNTQFGQSQRSSINNNNNNNENTLGGPTLLKIQNQNNSLNNNQMEPQKSDNDNPFANKPNNNIMGNKQNVIQVAEVLNFKGSKKPKELKTSLYNVVSYDDASYQKNIENLVKYRFRYYFCYKNNDNNNHIHTQISYDKSRCITAMGLKNYGYDNTIKDYQMINELIENNSIIDFKIDKKFSINGAERSGRLKREEIMKKIELYCKEKNIKLYINEL